MIIRVSRELGRPCRLHRDCRLEPRLTNSRLIPSFLVPSWWGRTGDKPMVSPSEETKRGEMDGKESQRPIIVLKRGNGPSRTPGSEGGAASWTGVGTTLRTSSLEGVSPRTPLIV
jgi:hypothetical protein